MRLVHRPALSTATYSESSSTQTATESSATASTPEPAGAGSTPATTTLATDIEFADSFFTQARGLMFRRSFSAGSALVFRFDRTKKRELHMLFVPFPIDAIWLVDSEVMAKTRLRPWVGFGRAAAETIIELPAGAADHVAVGDTVELVSDTSNVLDAPDTPDAPDASK